MTIHIAYSHKRQNGTSRKKAAISIIRLSLNTNIDISINSSMIVNADNAIRNVLKCLGLSLINLRIYAYASL